MKRNLIKFVFLIKFLFFVSFLQAQEIANKKLIKTKNYTFEVNQFENTKSVTQEDDIIKNKLFFEKDVFKVDPKKLTGTEDVYSSFIKVLGPTVINKIPQDCVTVVDFMLNRQGKIIKVNYVGVEKTGLTMDDFDRLTKFIKKNVSYAVPADDGTGKKYGNVFYILKFNELLNK